MENETNELTHWGIKGMKWGLRRYQNKDGSLTPAGRKRYNKELEKTKEELKVVKNKQKTQAKIDKLEALKKDVADQKKALKKGSKDENSETSIETKEPVNKRRERVMNSSDPAEIYKNRDVLSVRDLEDRLMRINTERRLSDIVKQMESERAAEEAAKNANKRTPMDYVNTALKVGSKANEVYKAATESALGKSILKSMGLIRDKKEPSLQDLFNNPDKYSSTEFESVKKKVDILKTMSDAKLWGKKDETTKKSEPDKKAEKKSEPEKKADKKTETKTETKKTVGGTYIPPDKSSSGSSSSGSKSHTIYDATFVDRSDYSNSSSTGRSYVSGLLGNSSTSSSRLLSPANISSINSMRNSGYTVSQIADRLDVSPSTVSTYSLGQSYISGLLPPSSH